jgi:predicted phosphodiesterase
MQFAFDLISDLHIDTYTDFDWEGQPTAPVAVVAGDVGRDRNQVCRALRHLGQQYQAVFYIDGNDEHADYRENLGQSYSDLVRRVQRLKNVVFLQDNVVVIDGVAILGTNGWWAFDFDTDLDSELCAEWYAHKENLSPAAVHGIRKMAATDAAYMLTSIKRLQTHQDVKRIVMVTHTVPDPALVSHDIDIYQTERFNMLGNRYMMQALAADTENKIHTWCFGHYHGSVDQTRGGIRFVNNCKGRGDTPWKRHVYHPQKIVIDY